MEFYQPYSILFSHSDDPNDELRIHTRVYVPGYQKLQVKITPSSPTPGVATTDIAIKAILSPTDREDRIEEIIALLDWDGTNNDTELEHDGVVGVVPPNGVFPAPGSDDWDRYVKGAYMTTTHLFIELTWP